MELSLQQTLIHSLYIRVGFPPILRFLPLLPSYFRSSTITPRHISISTSSILLNSTVNSLHLVKTLTFTMPSFSTLRWVKHGHTDHQPITFKDFLYHLRTEKAFTLPRPCIEFPIPGEPFAWESIAHRVGDDPHEPRRAEIEEMLKSGPKKAIADGKAPASEEKVVRDQG